MSFVQTHGVIPYAAKPLHAGSVTATTSVFAPREVREVAKDLDQAVEVALLSKGEDPADPSAPRPGASGCDALGAAGRGSEVQDVGDFWTLQSVWCTDRSLSRSQIQAKLTWLAPRFLSYRRTDEKLKYRGTERPRNKG